MPKIEKRGIEKLILRSKRGQISVFIIIGILILAGAAFYIMSEQKATFAGQEAPGEAIEDIPFDVGPIHSFVQACLQQKSGEALVQLGQSSGYIDPTTKEYHTKSFGFDSTNTRATETESLTYAEGFYLPYWHYMASPNTALNRYNFKSGMPTGRDVEKQINTYVEKHLSECLGSYSTFLSQGFEIKEGDMKAKTFLTPNAVVVDLKYPLTITKGDSVFEIKSYRASHAIALGKMLDFSAELTKVVSESQVFEKVIMQVLSGYGKLDGPMPPISASQSGGVAKRWQEPEVKKLVEGLVAQNVDIRLQGTANAEPLPLGDPVTNGVNQYLGSLKLEPNENFDPSKYEVNFVYLPTWSSYFDVVKGNMIGPTMTNSLPGAPIVDMAFGGLLDSHMYNYETPYDVSIPILVEVVDREARFKNPKSLREKGYTFQFAIEANVRDNEPVTAEFESVSTSQGYGGGFALFCNPDQKTSGPVTFNIVDKVTNQPLPDAQLAFNSGTGCPVGETNEQGSITTQLPRAIGELVVRVPGYLMSKKQFISPEPTLPKQETVKLHPLIETKIKLQKYNYNKKSGPVDDVRNLKTDQSRYWVRDALPTDLVPQEQAVVTFERVADDGGEYSAVASIMGPGVQTVSLAPGKYKVSILTQIRKSVSIPKCVHCICVRPSALDDDVCLDWRDVEGSDMSGGPFMESNIEFTTEITPAMLNSQKPVTFTTFVLNLADVPAGRGSPRLPHYNVAAAHSAGLNDPVSYVLAANTMQEAIHRIKVRERMVTDMQMLDKIAEDAKNNPELLKPR